MVAPGTAGWTASMETERIRDELEGNATGFKPADVHALLVRRWHQSSPRYAHGQTVNIAGHRGGTREHHVNTVENMLHHLDERLDGKVCLCAISLRRHAFNKKGLLD